MLHSTMVSPAAWFLQGPILFSTMPMGTSRSSWMRRTKNTQAFRIVRQCSRNLKWTEMCHGESVALLTCIKSLCTVFLVKQIWMKHAKWLVNTNISPIFVLGCFSNLKWKWSMIEVHSVSPTYYPWEMRWQVSSDKIISQYISKILLVNRQ